MKTNTKTKALDTQIDRTVSTIDRVDFRLMKFNAFLEKAIEHIGRDSRE